MSSARKALIVRRRDIERDPRPAGGGFEAVSLRFLPGSASRGLGIFCVNTAERVMGLTFDDGPSPEHTPRILDVLAKHGVRATFFVLASEARRSPEVVRRMAEAGHEVALHGEDHQSLLTMGAGEALASIRAARRTVEGLTGEKVRLFRPPYGECTILQALGIRAMGLDLVMWSSDGLDWLHDEESAIAERALSTVFPGSILLLHDNRADPETLSQGEVLPTFDRGLVTMLVLQSLARDGYSVVPAGELLAEYQQVRSAAKDRMVALR
jgi:peptidoglycan/xylan/chitin deacetylase (PgdA/CDA1 family)